MYTIPVTTTAFLIHLLTLFMPRTWTLYAKGPNIFPTVRYFFFFIFSFALTGGGFDTVRPYSTFYFSQSRLLACLPVTFVYQPNDHLCTFSIFLMRFFPSFWFMCVCTSFFCVVRWFLGRTFIAVPAVFPTFSIPLRCAIYTPNEDLHTFSRIWAFHSLPRTFHAHTHIFGWIHWNATLCDDVGRHESDNCNGNPSTKEISVHFAFYFEQKGIYTTNK